VADALDEAAVRAAIREARPEAVLNLLTAIPKNGPLRPTHLRATDELRDLGTRNLLVAAVDAGARRFLAESFMGIYNTAEGGPPYSEDARLGPPREGDPMGSSWDALRSLESQTLDGPLEGVVLRYANFHGPGVPSTAYMLKNVRRGTMPLPGGGGGVLSWIDIEDGARLTVDAMERAPAGTIYNVGDDEPVTVRDYTTEMARLAGARPPRSVPVWLAKLVAPYGARYLSEARLALTNDKAKRELGWQPLRPTYRESLAALVG